MAKKKILQDNEGQIWPVTVADCVYLTDGSKTVKKYIDDALAGKAPSSHTHNYAGSSSAGGVANSAAKLSTARNIKLTGAINGSGSFDGSKDITITTSKKIFEGAGTSGTKGYTAFAQLQITGTYTNRPIEFELICRGKATPCYVSIMFANSDSTDPAISSLYYWGSDYGVFAHKTAASTWLLYYTKSEAYDSVTLVENNYAQQGVTITYPGTFVTAKPTENVTNASLGGYIGYANRLANSRTITIGNKANSFDGSGNISFSLSDIGAAASSHGTHVSYGGNGSATTVSRSDHTHSYLPLSGGTITGGLIVNGNLQKVSSYDGKTAYTATPGGLSYISTNDVDNGTASLYSTTFTVKESDNRQFQICSDNGSGNLSFRSAHVNNTGGTGTGWNSWKRIYHTGYKPTPADIGASPSSHTHSYAGSSSAGGAANSAVKWSTARTLTIGATGKSVDGSKNISWNTSEILRQGSVTTGSWNDANTLGVYEVSNYSGTDGPTGAYQWGGLLTLRTGNVQNQVYLTHGSNQMWIRGGWAGDWNDSWDRVYTTSYKPTPSDIGAALQSSNTSPITFETSAAPTDVSRPTQIGHGMFGGYSNIKILANTDSTERNNEEYVQLAAGCGLTPESWDGIRVYGGYATSFGGIIETKNESWIDLTGYDEAYWYPVYCKTGISKDRGMSRIMCTVQLDSGSKPSWSTHDQGFTAILDLMTVGGGWGTADAHCIVLNYQAKWTNGTNPVGYRNLNNSSAPCFYLRGGGRYRLSTDYRNQGWQIVTAETTVNQETIKPETYNPGLNRWRGGIYTDIYGAIGTTLELANNVSLCGKDTYGNNKDLIGVDSSNQIYLGWANQSGINVNNFTHFKDAFTMDRSFGSFMVGMYENPVRIELVPHNGTDWNWSNKCYLDVNGQFYVSKQLSIGGHRITPYSGAGVSIINSTGSEFSGLEVKELWIGPYSGATYKFTVSPSAPSSPGYGTVWIQNN